MDQRRQIPSRLLSRQLADTLKRAVADLPADGVLLSGGIDSSLLAALDRRPIAITVGIEGGGAQTKPTPESGCFRCAAWAQFPRECGADLRYAQHVVEDLGLEWHPIVLTLDEAMEQLTALVRLTRSYDLGLLNDIPLFVGLMQARALGLKTVWTGEDADTLFGGYQVHQQHLDWQSYLSAAIPLIHPASARICQLVGVETRYPYLHDAIKAIALKLKRSDVIALRAGSEAGAFVDQFDQSAMGSRENVWGKIALRRAADGMLPDSIAWRPKTDLEFGAGTCRLESRLRSSLTPQNRERVAASGRRFWPHAREAHAGLWLIYDTLGLSPSPPNDREFSCQWCGAGVAIGKGPHCVTCGAFPATKPVGITMEQ